MGTSDELVEFYLVSNDQYNWALDRMDDFYMWISLMIS